MFDKLPPGVKPSDVGSENEPDECPNCLGEVYETGADTVFLGSRPFCDEDCRMEYVEEEWRDAIESDEQLPTEIEEFVQEEMI